MTEPTSLRRRRRPSARSSRIGLLREHVGPTSSPERRPRAIRIGGTVFDGDGAAGRRRADRDLAGRTRRAATPTAEDTRDRPR